MKNGSQVFQIGTRNATTLLRLKDGETQVLAGLISDDERMNAARIPGFGDIPVLGRLFANQEDKKDKTEIVLAITPRILNNIRRPESELSEYWSGNTAYKRPAADRCSGRRGSGTGRNTPQRQTAAPVEPPIAQEESQNQPANARAGTNTGCDPAGQLKPHRQRTAPTARRSVHSPDRFAMKGFTLIELVVTVSIVGILAAALLPLSQLSVKRMKEAELRAALRDIRTALDAYKKAGDDGRVEKEAEASGYPSSLAF